MTCSAHQCAYSVSREEVVDEAMKPTKRAIKVWCLADSKNGYILNFEVYNGQAEPSNTAEEDQEISELWAYVVMSLS